MLEIENKCKSEISQDMFLSYSIVWRVVKEWNHDNINRNYKDTNERSNSKTLSHSKKLITDYVFDADSSFCY